MFLSTTRTRMLVPMKIEEPLISDQLGANSMPPCHGPCHPGGHGLHHAHLRALGLVWLGAL